MKCVLYTIGVVMAHDEEPLLQMDDLLHQANNSLCCAVST